MKRGQWSGVLFTRFVIQCLKPLRTTQTCIRGQFDEILIRDIVDVLRLFLVVAC